ncbi:hypothetical protein M9Y10_026652 [Tritrichomonas musculus]|uniref:Amino acid transporter transmembrane domain-containing protein n=1 Tax=Tritrichomonas musculus TaxID=1915356 RepID=A0ABR2H660_9EUKA
MIGGDVLISEMRMKHTHSSSSTLLYYKIDQSGRNHYNFKNQNPNESDNKKSFFHILNMLINFNIATDPFRIGHIFQCGYLMNAIILLILSVITEFSFFILIQSWIYGRAYTYNEIWRELFGAKSYSWIVLVVVIINYIAFIIWSQNELYLYVAKTIDLLWPESPSILTNKWFLTYVLSAVFIIPTLFVKKLSNFSVMSMISNICLIIAFACLIVYFFHHQSNNHISFKETVEATGLKPFRSKVIEVFHAIRTLNLAIFCHPILSVLVPDYDNPKRSRLMQLTWISAITSLILHYFGGFFSYLINPENKNNIFYEVEVFNEDRSKIVYPEVIVGQVAVYCLSVFSNILYVHFTSRKVAELILPHGSVSTVSVFFCGLTVTLFASAMNFIGDDAYDIAAIIGGMMCMMLVYVFPSIYYYNQYRLSHKMFGILTILLIVFGSALSLAVLIIGIIEYVK